MFLYRVLKSTYELLDKTDIVRLAKSSFRDAAAFGLATRLLDASGDLVVVPTFIGGSLEPSADGSNALVSLKPGMALWYDSGEADDWLGEVKPVFFDTAQTVAFTTNTDGSGDDRIDVLSVRPIEIEEDSQVRKFKDPTSLSVFSQSSPQRTRLGFEFVVTEGVVSASPAVPATPAGTFKIAEVDRINAQVNVNAVDVTDTRVLDRTRAGFVEALAGMAIKTSALYFGESGANHYRIERDSDTAPTTLRLRDQAGAKVDLELEELTSFGGVIVDDIRVRADANDVLEFHNAAATASAMLLSRNTPFAFARFGWNDPGGALTNNDPADILDGDFGITSIEWKINGSDIYAEVVLTNALPSVAGTIVQVTCGGRKLTTGSITPIRCQAEIVSTTVIHLLFTGASGVMIEPVDSSAIRSALCIYAGDL